MPRTTCVNDQIAQRIEQAYLRRRPEWRMASVDRHLWASAARVLIAASEGSAAIPVDPELFVASQVRAGLISDPWMDLTHPRAGRRYVANVQRMVRRLRNELREELERVDDLLTTGKTLERILRTPSRKLSPLGRYVVAIRQGRTDLAKGFRGEAREQMTVCPLYQAALVDLITPEDSPLSGRSASPSRSPDATNFHLN